MESRIAAVAGAVALSAVLSSCGGSAAIVGASCLDVAPPMLVSPSSGASGVPLRLAVIVSYSENPSRAWTNVAFIPSNGSQAFFGGPYTVAAQGGQYSVASPALVPLTQYRLTVTSQACSHAQVIGSFTTQL